MHEVLMREGLVRSLNVVTVELAISTGLSRVANFAADFGLPKPAPYPALALGTTEVTPLQIAAAYAAFANGGKAVVPTVVRRVSDTNTGEIIVDERPQSKRVIRESTAYMITDMLSDVIKRGTARRAQVNFKNVAVAGKTGTSRDGWFVGYTPNLVCAVWIGFDDNKQLGLTGAEAALPAWTDFIRDAVAIRPSLGGTSFPRPADIVTVRIDPESGALAGPSCPSSIVVSVAQKYAPSIECWKHAPLYYESGVGEYYETNSDIEEGDADRIQEQFRSLPDARDSRIKPGASDVKSSTDGNQTPSIGMDYSTNDRDANCAQQGGSQERNGQTRETTRETRRRTQSEINRVGRPTLITSPRPPSER
jgi:membrane carboxypeptidase/penicillin-binding protein